MGLGLLQPGTRLTLPVQLFLQLSVQVIVEGFCVPELVAQALCGADSIQICLALSAQDILVIPVIFVADDPGVLHGRLVSVKRILQAVHLFHSADHGGQVIICQHLEGQVEQLLHLGGAEILGQLGSPHHNQKLDQLIILPDVFKTKDLIVDHLFVCGLAFCPATGVPDELAKFLLAQREILAIYLFIEPEAIWTDPTPIPEAETPEVDALSLLGPHPHTDGSILLCTGLSELQVQITGGLLLRVVAQQIKFHFTIPGAEGIQTLWTSVPIQNKGDKTLGGNGFASGVISPQQDMSVLKGELLLVVQPKVEKSQFIHLPAAHCTPTLPIRFDKRRGSAQPACPQPDRAKYPCPAPPEASNWPCMRSTLD